MPLDEEMERCRQRFFDMASTSTVVPVWRELVGDSMTPVLAFLGLVGGSDTGFVLESVEQRGGFGRYSFVGRRPLGTITVRSREVTGTGALEPMRVSGSLRALAELLGRYCCPKVDGLPPLHSGVVGYLGYDVVREVEKLQCPPPDDRGLPDAILMLIGQLVAFDHWRQKVFIIDNVVVEPGSDLPALFEDSWRRLVEMGDELAGTVPELPVGPSGTDAPVAARRRTTTEEYCSMVQRAKEYIAAGDIFQVVLSQRFDFDLEADPFDLYRALRQVNPSPYMYFLRTVEVTLVGSSPETMVKVEDGRVWSRPIAGTRRRGASPERDRELADEMLADPKERSEHIMLVDMARNDLGRIARFKSEVVEELMTIESFSHVLHMTSQVTAELDTGLGPTDVLAATMPAGTVSGAPKVRAMEIIDELEPFRRGPYAGVVGYVDFSGNIDTAIAIRTVVVDPAGRAYVQAGAGIVADSDPLGEDQECHNKAAGPLAAVPAARRMTRARVSSAGRS
jgi:anthranilate synthase component 1